MTIIRSVFETRYNEEVSLANYFFYYNTPLRMSLMQKIDKNSILQVLVEFARTQIHKCEVNYSTYGIYMKYVFIKWD